jgi:hypothetical protein
MLEAGVPVIFMYIADVHDQNPSPASGSHTFGPGEAGYVAQLAAYNKAWGQFFARLKADGIDETNTLFVFTADENDHFVGGKPSPANCDGVTTPCTYTQVGELQTSLNRVLLTQKNNTTAFTVHNDDAPTVQITGNPAPTAAITRTLEKDLDALTATSLITGNTDKLSVRLADQAEMKLLHMITSDPARTPTFTMFGNSDYFFSNATPNTNCSQAPACITQAPTFAWNHGDFQTDIVRTWVGMVGPGVLNLGVDNSSFTDHTDIRPTILALLGLQDDYIHDGRVLAEKIGTLAQPLGIQNSPSFLALAATYKQLNATFGQLTKASLDYANASIVADDTTYANYLATMNTITTSRNALANQIKPLLNGAAFSNQPIDSTQAQVLIQQAEALIAEVQALAQNSVTTVAAVSPNAQATTVNSTVTAFAAIVNAGSTTAAQCSVGLPANFPGVLLFQTTDPTTNLPTGTLNKAVDIAPGKTQTFVFAITPTAPVSQEIPLQFTCGGGAAVPTIPGVNTFLLTASSTPTPDMIMIDATATKDGNLIVPGATASGAIASAAVNIGAAGTVTFTATDTPYGQAPHNLPVSLLICQVNSSGTCINPTTPAPSTTVNVAAGQTVTFATFVTGQGTTIPYDPANNRIFIIGKTGGVAVGEASIALKMQPAGTGTLAQAQ